MTMTNLLKRAAKAHVKHTGALGLFEQAATQLEAAANEHEEVASEAQEIADRHEMIRSTSRQNAVAARTSAEKIRALVS